jgi:hypothetical protein
MVGKSVADIADVQLNDESLFLLDGRRAANDNLRALGAVGSASSATIGATRVVERKTRTQEREHRYGERDVHLSKSLCPMRA